MGEEARGQKRLIAAALGQSDDANAPINLQKQPRTHETIIQQILLLCGAISILTTIGIVFVLGNEALAFFTRQLWENSNKHIVTAIDAEQTQFSAGIEGKTLTVPGIIRVESEQMNLTAYEPNLITLDLVGTGGGFARFCAGEADIANASRMINAEETATCASKAITPLAFRVGTDAIAIAVNPANTFVTDLTIEELAQLFGEAKLWSDVRADWPAEPIYRVTPGKDSGTLDFFVDAVAPGKKDVVIANATVTSEDDDQLARNVRDNEHAIGFFGFAYYQKNSSRLKLVSIGGVTPDAATVEDGSYALARPLFIYSDATLMANKPQVAAFINYYLTHVTDMVKNVGYFPASDEALAEARATWLAAMGISDTSGELPAVEPNKVTGSVVTTGSSTVHPLTIAVADGFHKDGFLPQLTVERGINGTSRVAHPAGVVIDTGSQVTLTEFFTNTTWSPQIGEFGILPLFNATLMTSIIGMLVALPLGLGAAIYMSEYASPRVRNLLKPIIEILAGIPTVVYGYFALTFVTPLLRAIFGVEVVNIYNTASAGIVIGILITPLVSTMSEDALSAVPRSLREASYGLGATKLETTIKVVIPAAISGLAAAFIVAISRAIGETMVVAIAAGAGPNFTFNPFDSAETMTGHIARISGGDLSYDSVDYNSIFAIGLALFTVTMALNLISRYIINRFREVY